MTDRATKKADFFDLDLAHYSLQFSDPSYQQLHDAKKVFAQGYHGITGTEAGQQAFQKILRVAAHAAGYTFYEHKSNWVSIRKDLIVPGSYEKRGQTFVDNDLYVGRGHDLNVAMATVKTKGLGTWSLLASHYATKGRPGAPERLRVNEEHNETLARGIGDLADLMGKGSALVFYGGDQNIVDRDTDTFFGEDLTSVWDELGIYENTGHGNIDVMASYDKDKRVKATYIRALDDREQFMFADHYPVEAGFRVKRIDN